MSSKTEKLANENVKKLITILAIPTIISMLITNLYNMADSFFVGQLKDSAQTGAIGVIISFMSIVQACGFFFGHGSGNYISRELGKKNYSNTESMAATGFFSAFIFGLVIAIFGLIFLKPFAQLLGSTSTILPYAMDYLKYILIATPFMTSALVLNNQLRFQGSAKNAMVGIATGAIINVALDPIFIYGKFGFPAMGVSGAGLATAISQIISFIILFCMTFMPGNIRINIKKFKFKLSYYKEILRGGLPSLCRQGIASLSIIFLNFAAKKYAGSTNPDDVISALSIVSRLMGLSFALIIGFNQGYQPVCAFSYGAKAYKRLKSAFYFTVIVGEILGLIIGITCFVFSNQLICLFADKDVQKDVITLGVKALKLQSLAFPVFVFSNTANMSMQAMGKAVRASILASGRQGLCFIPLLFVLPLIWGLQGLLYVQPLADLLTFIISVPFMNSIMKELK